MANLFSNSSNSFQNLNELIRVDCLNQQLILNRYDQMEATNELNSNVPFASSNRNTTDSLSTDHVNGMHFGTQNYNGMSLNSMNQTGPRRCPDSLPLQALFNDAGTRSPTPVLAPAQHAHNQRSSFQLNRNRYSPYWRSNANFNQNYTKLNCFNQNQRAIAQHPNDAMPPAFASSHAGSAANGEALTPNGTVTLQITNMDYSLEENALRNFLLNQLKPITPVISLTFEGSLYAKITVPNLYFAKQVVTNLHRKKIGHKRMIVSYTRDSSQTEFNTLRCQVAGLLKDVPFYTLPMYKFRELFQSRFKTSIGVLDLYKMPDVCTITGDNNEDKYIRLQTEFMNSLNTSPLMEGLQHSVPYCIRHFKREQEKGWAEQDIEPLPNVMLPLAEVQKITYALLKDHAGDIPIASIVHCIQAELNIEITPNEQGVNLEHLIACIHGIEIHANHFGIKILAWLDTSCSASANNQAANAANASYHAHNFERLNGNAPAKYTLADSLHQISREIIELLKMSPKAAMKFNRFIPAYHNHFGKQCRVADYGYTKLIELFEALSPVIQIMGDGENRQITLAHRVQVRRFTSDLLRVLRTPGNNKVSLSELPQILTYAQNRRFDITDYGVCHISDIIEGLVNSNTVVVQNINNGKDALISIPKRKQTTAEMEKTSIFAGEMIELFRDALQYSIHFQKFVRSYHYHFGYQCRLSDYGFLRLADLLEAIRGIIEMETSSEEDKKLSLSPVVARRVFAEQCEELIRESTGSYMASVKFELILKMHKKKYGYQILPQTLGAQNINSAIALLPYVEINEKEQDIWITCHRENLAFRKDCYSAAALLLNYAEGVECATTATDAGNPSKSLTITNFINKFNEIYKSNICETKIKAMNPIIELQHLNGESILHTTKFFQFLLSLVCLLETEKSMPLYEIKNALGCKLNTTFEFGYPNVFSLITAYPDIFKLKVGTTQNQSDVTLIQDCELRKSVLNQKGELSKKIAFSGQYKNANNAEFLLEKWGERGSNEEIEDVMFFENSKNLHKKHSAVNSKPQMHDLSGFRQVNYSNVGNNKENSCFGGRNRRYNYDASLPYLWNNLNSTSLPRSTMNAHSATARLLHNINGNFFNKHSNSGSLPPPIVHNPKNTMDYMAQQQHQQSTVKFDATMNLDHSVKYLTQRIENKADTPPSEQILTFWSDPAWLKHSTGIHGSQSPS